jgi:quinoprotein glucose dehydrogenase
MRLALWFAAMLLVTASAQAQQGGWPLYGGDAAGTRYSPLTQITPENAGELEVAWTYRTGEVARRGPKATAFSSVQNTPVLVDGSLIVCTPFNRIVALDPATGRERWVFDAGLKLDLEVPHYNCRGVVPWTDPDAPADTACKTRILFGTNDLQLMAIDSRTGKPCAGFGTGGAVRVPAVMPAEARKGEARIVSAPVILNGVLVTGTIVLDNQRENAPLGTVFAFDPRTGAPRWTFDPIPRDPADPAYATWLEGSAERSGAANVWSTMVVDEARDLVFLPVSSPAPDFWGGDRKGDNLYSGSLVVLKGATGKVVWYRQLVHHDIWDWDVSSPPMLIDIRKDGTVIPAVVQNTKQGFVFVFNRETGEPVFGVEERPVPQRKLPGEWLSPTQPFPVKPLPLIDTDVTPDDAWGFTFWDRAKCREKIAALRYDGIFTAPDTGAGSLAMPGYAGGANWGGPAYDPKRQWMFVNINAVPQATTLVPRAEAPKELQGLMRAGEYGALYEQKGAPYAVKVEWLLSPFGAPCTRPPWGELVAIDMASGDVVWRVPLGSIENELNLPFRWNLGQPNVGGPIVTAGGVLFIGAARDRIFRAFDTRDGSELFRHQFKGGIGATPMTYEADGRQFVVIASGNLVLLRAPPDDLIVAFALPKKRR